MINCIAYETTVRVKVENSSRDEFLAELALIHSIPKQDRSFVDETTGWLIRNPENYRHIPFIDNALKMRDAQPMLF